MPGEQWYIRALDEFFERFDHLIAILERLTEAIEKEIEMAHEEEEDD